MSHQNAAPLEHVGPVEDGLLVVVMLERDHKRRPASDLGPGVATLETVDFMASLKYTWWASV